MNILKRINQPAMFRNRLLGSIDLFTSASQFLALVRNPKSRTNVLRSKFIPPVLGSDSLGSFKVTLKHEPGKHAQFHTKSN
jgi:hypothetical protein